MMQENAASKALDQSINTFFSVFDNRNAAPDLSVLYELFINGAMITKFTHGQYQCMSLEAFIAPRQQLLQSGQLEQFHEWETSHRNFIQGGIATRIAQYQKEGIYLKQAFFGQGRKSFQCLLDTTGWKIVSILWEDEEPH